ncbi:MAG: hypothetical protein KGH61_05165 [Candidatus Micrarchaeota archaeon]|nr:hypothetical protein [Candidatus Micrarchaeota archaeon]MDE1848305.1 hypothetical protein [Candidatus Micrarchaeota archaeon]
MRLFKRRLKAEEKKISGDLSQEGKEIKKGVVKATKEIERGSIALKTELRRGVTETDEIAEWIKNHHIHFKNQKEADMVIEHIINEAGDVDITVRESTKGERARHIVERSHTMLSFFKATQFVGVISLVSISAGSELGKLSTVLHNPILELLTEMSETTTVFLLGAIGLFWMSLNAYRNFKNHGLRTIYEKEHEAQMKCNRFCLAAKDVLNTARMVVEIKH